MANERITLCAVSMNAKYSLALMRESYAHYNPDWPAKLIVIDNGSTDGALEYAKQHANLLLLGENLLNHGVSLTAMVRRVDTEFCITIDNDISFTAPNGVQFMIDHMDEKTYCVCPDRYGHPKGVPFGTDMTNAYSPNICCGLFRTEVIQHLTQELTLGYYVDYQARQAMETGGLIWRVAKLFGLDSVELPELWHYCFHHGQISTLFNFVPNYPSYEGMAQRYLDDPASMERIKMLSGRYERVMKDLAAIRGVSVEDLPHSDPPLSAEPVIEKLVWEQQAKAAHPFLIQHWSQGPSREGHPEAQGRC